MGARLQAATAQGTAPKGKKAPTPPPGQADMAKTVKEQLTALTTLSSELNRKGKVEYRVFINVSKPDEEPARQVTIFESGAKAEAASLDFDKKEPKGRRK
jgi:hypothetical protein